MISKTRGESHEILVTGTMKAGKTTLINALLGYSLLPVDTEACTHQICKVVFNDEIPTGVVRWRDSGGNLNRRNIYHSSNLNETILFDRADVPISIEGNFRCLQQFLKQIVVYDTPGVNNSRCLCDGERSLSFINDFSRGTILYVANAGQLGSNDEKNLLDRLVQLRAEPNKSLNFIFVINKADLFDLSLPIDNSSSLNAAASGYRDFLESTGFISPIVIPVSSQLSLLARKRSKWLEKREHRKLHYLLEQTELDPNALIRSSVNIDNASLNLINTKRRASFYYWDLPKEKVILSTSQKKMWVRAAGISLLEEQLYL